MNPKSPPRAIFLLHVTTILAITTGVLLPAGDWPEFRGPTGQGHSAADNLPLSWTKTHNVIWKRRLPGNGWSSPVCTADHIYLTTAFPADPDDPKSNQSLRTLCIDAADGKILWNVEVFAQDGVNAPKIHKKNSHASATPVLEPDSGRLYVHFGHQGTACLDLTGKIVWKNRELAYKPVHGNGGSPILAEDKLIFNVDAASDPFVVALHTDTGKIAWKTPRSVDVQRKFSFSTPLLIQVDGQPQVVSPGSGAVSAYDPRTGEELWRVRYGEGYSVVPRPVYGHSLVFLASGFNQPVAMAIRPDGRGDVTDSHVAWKIEKRAPHTPSLLLVGDEIYMVSDSGIASCLDARTGKIHWQERIPGNYSASPLHAGGTIYLQNEEGTTAILQAGTQFQILGENHLGQRTFASHAVCDGDLLIRGEIHLFRIRSR